MHFDDKKLELSALKKLQDTIREKIAQFGMDDDEHMGMEDKTMDMGMDKKPIEGSEEEEAMESPEEEKMEGEDVAESEDPFKKYMEEEKKPSGFQPKGKMMGSATIEIIKKKMGKR